MRRAPDASGEPHLWRKKRAGREYGSFHSYVGRRIVNLGTDVLDEARRKARELVGAVAGPSPGPVSARAESPPAAVPASSGATVTPLHAWAARRDSATPPAAGTAPAGGAAMSPPAAPAVLTPAMGALADGLANALARLNGVVLAVGVKYLANVQPPKVDPDEIDRLEKTWATGLRELMLIHGLQWWHILAAQNAALALSLYQHGTKLPPKLAGPVAVPAAAAA